jgi:hypothetical protein
MHKNKSNKKYSRKQNKSNKKYSRKKNKSNKSNKKYSRKPKSLKGGVDPTKKGSYPTEAEGSKKHATMSEYFGYYPKPVLNQIIPTIFSNWPWKVNVDDPKTKTYYKEFEVNKPQTKRFLTHNGNTLKREVDSVLYKDKKRTRIAGWLLEDTTFEPYNASYTLT